ncbi:MAG: hypothetical protein AAF989_08490, partial [Planctomycetota bacterium]
MRFFSLLQLTAMIRRRIKNAYVVNFVGRGEVCIGEGCDQATIQRGRGISCVIRRSDPPGLQRLLLAWRPFCLLSLLSVAFFASPTFGQVEALQRIRLADTEVDKEDGASRIKELLFGRQKRKPARPPTETDEQGPIVQRGPAGLRSFVWNFGPNNDINQDGRPDGWGRREGRDYPNYVKIGIAPDNPRLEESLRAIDAWLLSKDAYLDAWAWMHLHVPLIAMLQPKTADLPSMLNWIATNPVLSELPPTLPDFFVDRHLRIELDGGLAEVWSTTVPTNKAYQYRFECRLMTSGLRHDTAVAELVFLDRQGREVAVMAIDPVGRTTDWTRYRIDRIRPPMSANRMLVRLRVQGSGDGLRDVHGVIGLGQVRIEQFPQLRMTTDRARGIYRSSQSVTLKTRVMGLTRRAFSIRFRLMDHKNRILATHVVPVSSESSEDEWDEFSEEDLDPKNRISSEEPDTRREDTLIDWKPPKLQPGFYVVDAALQQDGQTSLASRTTLAVIEQLVDGPPQGPFGWTLRGFDLSSLDIGMLGVGSASSAAGTDMPKAPAEISGSRLTSSASKSGAAQKKLSPPIGAKEEYARDAFDTGITESPGQFVEWLQSLGVAWVKVPAWLDPDDIIGAERMTILFRKLQDAGIQIVGLLDQPPSNRLDVYDLRGRDDRVAAQLFREEESWRKELEPVMSRLTLKCRVWQLGDDHDFSFLGRPGLKDSIRGISLGLQGFGQPIEVALSWPWLEPEMPSDEVSWQAICRSSEDPLNADELDAALGSSNTRSTLGPRTWLLVDPIDRDQYERDDRIRDLVLRMATIQKHRVEAAFVSDPMGKQSGLLRYDGRPGELLLPFRTTSRLLGSLRQVG